MTKQISLLNTLLVALVIGALAFYGGMRYSQYTRVSQFARLRDGGLVGGGNFGGPDGNRMGGMGGRQLGMRAVMGEVVSRDEKSLSVKMPDGSSKVVLLTDKTEIAQSATASVEALETGSHVRIFGDTNTDGSVSATNIQIVPSDQIPPIR